MINIVTAIVIVVIWLVLLEIASSKVLLFVSSQVVLLAFIFGNTVKTVFESIIFLFIVHPYDVGDRCVVDGVPVKKLTTKRSITFPYILCLTYILEVCFQMLVEEMNLLSTVFLKLDNEKVYYPNAVLATKPISNYFRSPDMSETVEFSIAFSTPISKIAHLKERIAE